MARIRDIARDSSSDEEQPSARALYVRGRRYQHSAAKFWPTLVDEVRRDFPQCSVIELSVPVTSPLSSDHLHPVLSLERQFERLAGVDLRKVISETLAELDIMGGPASVRVRLLAGDAELAAATLADDCVDAEIFPYLAVWLLEWAGIDSCEWGSEFLAGEFLAEDRLRRCSYDISFGVRYRELSEGLRELVVALLPGAA